MNENKRFCAIIKNSLKIYTLSRKLAQEEDEKTIEKGKVRLYELCEELETILSQK